CVVAEDRDARRLAGSCFYHPRSTHVSLGIMNVHPDYFGQGVASQLLRYVTEVADRQRKPMRLVSSALNLDSFSLYNRVGFVPRAIYHDMIMKVPDGGLEQRVPGSDRVRQATQHDLAAMVELEWSVNHIRREKDLRYFVENPDGIWHVSVLEGKQGGLDGFLVSVAHPASNMLGPGIMRTEEDAAVLILAELNQNRGRQPVWLVPAQCPQLVHTMYAWGAVNCELHFAQSRGDWTPPQGIVMPTFMPETG
ncbi:MAG: GNAT family N-acetyltransferase, partial [Pirellulaceae bacterium]|nr:GNAT family N-acetyltransferase [Pirellulaceae bacterium]